MKQCAAVRIVLLLRIEPPHHPNGVSELDTDTITPTCQGYSCFSATTPPTILNALLASPHLHSVLGAVVVVCAMVVVCAVVVVCSLVVVCAMVVVCATVGSSVSSVIGPAIGSSQVTWHWNPFLLPFLFLLLVNLMSR